MGKLFLKRFSFLLFACSLQVGAASLEEVCSLFKDQVREGDLVFVSIDNALFQKVEETQNHWSSHVGIAFYEEGQWWVFESTIPLSKRTPFCDFVEKGWKSNVAITRYRSGVTLLERDRMLLAAKDRLGILYHTGFKLKSRRMFCSKFVREVYQEGAGVDVGEVQNFRELLSASENPEVIRFWRWWYFGWIPWRRDTVTPASQFHDPQFEEVLSYSASH